MTIEFTNPEVIFDKHFNNPENKRIIFSGKFGSGKTYFLKSYFQTLENKEHTNAFWLSPVKYATSQNEDIFEYIKVDIANQLLLKPSIYSIIKQKFGETDYLYQYINSTGNKGAKLLINICRGLIISKSISEKGLDNIGDLLDITGESAISLETLLDTTGNYRKFKENINIKLEEEAGLLREYINNSINVKGSIYENDIVTVAINIALHKCSNEGKLQNVLIIDDFDRLDPEHIFRILNILSVHNDTYEADNKFGFDKIIIVCDVRNIEAIYRHKYGVRVDFQGYISKFFSTQIFHFNNILAVQNFCKNQIRNILNDENSEKLLGLLLSYLVEKDKLTVRNIMKFKAYKITETPMRFGDYSVEPPREFVSDMYSFRDKYNFHSNSVNTFHVSTEDYPFIQAVKIMCTIFGDFDNLLKEIDSLDFDKEDSYNKEYLNSIIISFLALLHHAAAYGSNMPQILLADYEKDSRGFQTLLSVPTETLFNAKIKIPTGWNENNKYNNIDSFYKNVHENLKSIYVSEINTENYGNFKGLFAYLKVILVFLDKSGVLYHIGITKSSK